MARKLQNVADDVTPQCKSLLFVFHLLHEWKICLQRYIKRLRAPCHYPFYFCSAVINKMVKSSVPKIHTINCSKSRQNWNATSGVFSEKKKDLLQRKYIHHQSFFYYQLMHKRSSSSSSTSTSRIGPFDPFRLQSYNCSLQRFFGLPIVLLPCGL